MRHNVVQEQTVPHPVPLLAVEAVLHNSQGPRSATLARSKDIAANCALIVGCGCYDYHTKAEAISKPVNKHKTNRDKAAKHTSKMVQNSVISDKATLKGAETSAEKNN